MTEEIVVEVIKIIIDKMAEETVAVEEEAAILEEMGVAIEAATSITIGCRRLISMAKDTLEQDQIRNSQFIQTENINGETVFTIHMDPILIQTYPDHVTA